MDDLISRQDIITLPVMPKEHRKYQTYNLDDAYEQGWFDLQKCIEELPSAQPEIEERMSETEQNVLNDDFISRKGAIDAIEAVFPVDPMKSEYAQGIACGAALSKTYIEQLPSAQPDLGKYEYHYDHTDCIWYRSEARNRCPSTCAQYRDGWNDAMNYIFRDGKGYRPYRRDRRYEDVDTD